jgi:ABC-type uncharacterized transport system auxiliary subunit
MIARSARQLATAALVAATIGAGCVTLGGDKPAPPIQRFQLSYPAPAAVSEPLPATVRVIPLRTAAAYDRSDIAVRRGPHRLEFYNYRRWAVHPARMIGDLLARDLAESHAFRAVLQGPSPLTADYVLGGFVEEIEERDDGDGRAAHLRIRFTLALRTGSAESEPLFQRSYEAIEPTGDRGDALADAMSRALATISERMRGDLAAAIRDQG